MELELERLKKENEALKIEILKRDADSILENAIWKKHSLDNTIKAIRSGNYSPNPFPKPIIDYYGRDDAMNIAEDYIFGVVRHSSLYYNETNKKFALLGISGVKGIGRSQLLVQIGSRMESVKVDGKQVRSLYLNFRSYYTVPYIGYEKRSDPITAFGQILLDICNVPEDLHSQLNFNQCLIEFRSILQLAEDDILLILVDGLGGLEAPEILLLKLMSEMDTQRGKLIFIFAHIRELFLNGIATSSGREIRPIKLTPLDIDIWKQVYPDLITASTKFPSLHQLLLSLSGHPRAIFDGIKRAIKNSPTFLKNPDDQISVARKEIIRCCKFNEFSDGMLEDVILKWFSQTRLTEKEIIEWKTRGLIHTMKSGTQEKDVDFLLPLLVQDWSSRLSYSNSIAFHLNKLYLSDTQLDQDSEAMVKVMYHYEAALIIAQRTEEFTLQSLYKSKHFNNTPYSHLVNFQYDPTVNNWVVEVPEFVDQKTGSLLFCPKDMFTTLKHGIIVVSEMQSKDGMEYLVPFNNKETNSLEIAFVQCKFVCSHVDWSEIDEKMNFSLEAFRKDPLFENLTIFPVVYTTVDQSKINPKTFKEGIYFTAADLFSYTNKLGVLRLHTQKLGNALSTEYPILQRSSSDVFTQAI